MSDSPTPRKYFDGFRSSSSVPRLQPDPFVLKQMDSEVRAFVACAKMLRLSVSFTESMVAWYVDAFRTLDSIDRGDPFWEGTNHRPTQYKLKDYYRYALALDPGDQRVRGHRVAIETVGFHGFDAPAWEQLNESGSVDPVWIVDAALHADSAGSYDVGSIICELLKRSNLVERVSDHLNDLLHSVSPASSIMFEDYAAKWAKQLLAACEDR